MNLSKRHIERLGHCGLDAKGTCYSRWGGRRFHPEPLEFLYKAAEAKSAIIWPAIALRLEMQRKERGTWYLLNWLRGDRSIRGAGDAGIDAFPPAMVFEWVDVDAVDRACVLAQHCPPSIARPDEPANFARLMLERYGSIEQVRRSLHVNNFSEGWIGPASEHYRRKLAALDANLEVETNDNVRIWLKEHREQLERSIEREVEWELRESER